MEYNLNMKDIQELNSASKGTLHKCLMDEARALKDITDYVFAVIEYDYGDNNREYALFPLHIRDFQQGGYSYIYIEFNQLLDVVYSF